MQKLHGCSNASSDFRHKNFNYNYTSKPSTVRLLMFSLADLFGFFLLAKYDVPKSQMLFLKKRHKISHPKTSFGNWPSFQFFAGLKKITKNRPCVDIYGHVLLQCCIFGEFETWRHPNEVTFFMVAAKHPGPKSPRKTEFLSDSTDLCLEPQGFLWILTGTIAGPYIGKNIYVKASESDSELKLSTYDFWEVPEGLECFH